MKSRFLLLLLVLVVGFISVLPAQKSSDRNTPLTAIRLKSNLTKAFMTTARCAAYKVDEKGVLRPQKGYHMYYKKPAGFIVIKPETQTESFITGSYQEVELPGGIGKMSCYCTEGADDCAFKFIEEDEPNRGDYVCTGSCGCGIGIMLYPEEGIVEYETLGGRWFNP